LIAVDFGTYTQRVLVYAMKRCSTCIWYQRETISEVAQ